jgi:hypothetical protein
MNESEKLEFVKQAAAAKILRPATKALRRYKEILTMGKYDSLLSRISKNRDARKSLLSKLTTDASMFSTGTNPLLTHLSRTVDPKDLMKTEHRILMDRYARRGALDVDLRNALRSELIRGLVTRAGTVGAGGLGLNSLLSSFKEEELDGTQGKG